MSFLQKFDSLILPPLRSREEMKDILCREEYGYLPKVEYSISTSDPTIVERRYNAGRCEHSYVNLTIAVGDRAHSFRVDRLFYKDGLPRPLVIFNNFHRMDNSPYFAMEEMSEREANYLVFCYKDVSSDDGDFGSGLAPLLLPYGQNTGEVCGKIGIWAWAAMRVLDYGLTLNGVDENNVAIVGHSRLGKTALYTAMNDDRFKFVFSNNAGCSGDALSTLTTITNAEKEKGERGEEIADILRNFPYWFCKNYQKYAQKGYSDEFDQHYLIASIAPRFVMIGSNKQDLWADPVAQRACALAAGKTWDQQGLSGAVGLDGETKALGGYTDGHVGLCYIDYPHFLSRHSWKYFMEFIKKHKN